MDVLKITAEGLTTSFRYPHFRQGVHLTYEMPPPATLYGHVCSAIGDLIPRDTTRFAYHFAYTCKFEDYEHLHFPQKSPKRQYGKAAKAIKKHFGSSFNDPKVDPIRREILYQPRLTLYLDNLALAPYFRSPRYVVVLGRSQDLMTYTSVETVTLEQPADNRAFYSGTLLPLELSALLGGYSFAATMPRYIDEQRRPVWEQYALLPEQEHPPIYPDNSLQQMGTDFEIWIDPDTAYPGEPTLKRGVIWHEW